MATSPAGTSRPPARPQRRQRIGLDRSGVGRCRRGGAQTRQVGCPAGAKKNAGGVSETARAGAASAGGGGAFSLPLSSVDQPRPPTTDHRHHIAQSIPANRAVCWRPPVRAHRGRAAAPCRLSMCRSTQKRPGGPPSAPSLRASTSTRARHRDVAEARVVRLAAWNEAIRRGGCRARHIVADRQKPRRPRHEEIPPAAPARCCAATGRAPSRPSALTTPATSPADLGQSAASWRQWQRDRFRFRAGAVSRRHDPNACDRGRRSG